MIAAVNHLFGFATSIANSRATSIGMPQIRERLCNAFVDAFGYSSSFGNAIYQQVKSSSDTLSLSCMSDGTQYATIETQVYNVLDGAFPSVSYQDKTVLALSVNAVIFAYYTYSSINIEDIESLIYQVLLEVSEQVNGKNVFTTDTDQSPFTTSYISLILNSGYDIVISGLAQSPRDTPSEIVNYNWYEVESIFANPNLQIMKDIENQYYYLSGRLIYSSDVSNVEDCVSLPLSINTPTGIITTSYIANEPCINRETYIGPITGISFYRVFNDGPYSSGNFDGSLLEQYKNLDRKALDPTDYKSNSEILCSFNTGSDGNFIPIVNSSVYINGEGIYNLNQEYSNLPESYDCSHTYSGNMHVGDSLPKIKCDRDIMGECVNCRFEDGTGFKFASLELDYGAWYKTFAYLKTNPPTSTQDVLKRALNILPYSYLATLNESDFTSVNTDGEECIGYPQITGVNSIPNLAFVQSFNSSTFSKVASLALYPSIGTSNNGNGDSSDRTYEISPNPIFIGTQNATIPFGETGKPLVKFSLNISSNLVSGDNITKKFFGMGDAFQGKYNLFSAVSYNAGFAYTGYLISGSGVYENSILFSNQFSDSSLLGSPVKNINFISGYKNLDGSVYKISKIYAQSSGEELIPYYYFDNKTLPPDLQVQDIEMSSLGVLPPVFEDDPTMMRLSGTQKVENYLPRYSSGAFASQDETFLYPNAKSAANTYKAGLNGFPLRVKFVLNIREEAVKEFYARYRIGNDGSISSQQIMPVYRASPEGNIDFSKSTPLMTEMFTPNSIYYTKEYNFNNFSINNVFEYSCPTYTVDNNWSPFISRSFSSDGHGGLIKNFYQTNEPPEYSNNYFAPSGKNTEFYNNQAIFYFGTKITGRNSIPRHIFYNTGDDEYNIEYGEKPSADGLYHNYKTSQITGYLIYTPPYFNMQSGQGYINDQIKQVFPIMVDGNTNVYNSNQGNDHVAVPGGAFYQYINGNSGFIPTGSDPFFFEYMGGRSGGFLVEQEGGYHSKGIIGDVWNNFSNIEYGMKGQLINDFGIYYASVVPTRWVYNDNTIVLTSSTPKQTNIFTRGLAYNPYVVVHTPYIQFNGTELYPFSINGDGGNLALDFSGDYATFSLKDYMPLKLNPADLYDQTGLVIGPFDRDMEIGVLGSNYIYSIGNLYLNGNQLTDPSGLAGTFGWQDKYAMTYTVSNNENNNGLNTGVMPNLFGRDINFSIMGVIPKDTYAIFNLSGIQSGYLGFSDTVDDSGNSISQSKVSLRPRKMIGASVYDQSIHKGERGWIDSLMFVDNGMTKQFTIDTTQFEDLSDSYTFVTYTNSGKLYPIPYSDFTGMGSFDTNGNLIYPANATVENYWRQKMATNNKSMYISGWREGSRISFTFDVVEVEYDVLPYQHYKLIVPSGNCLISGEMGYVGQAEASIYSAGVALIDSTDIIPNGLDEYKPSYLSNVLGRLEAFTGVSGSLPNEVLPAPSIMIQRKVVASISGGQQYNKLLNYPPYNYNKTNWQAFSDLETYNEGETLEATMPNDPITFVDSNLIFSASQGQSLPNGLYNPVINKKFDVTGAYQMYDSMATDAVINSGLCITNLRGGKVRIEQLLMLSGILTPIGTSLSMIKNGLY
jgi:hypothetical protein